MNSLQDAFTMGLQEAYYAERSLLQAMPQLAQSAQSEELRAALEQHELETQQQVQMLEPKQIGSGWFAPNMPVE